MERFGLNPQWNFAGFNMDALIGKIIQNPLFLRLKNVVENNLYHDHEDAYFHSIKTKDIALKEIKGDFISNPDAKNRFVKFTSEEFNGMKRADIMVLIALLHDIGKMLYVKEGNKTHSLLVTNSSSTTVCPGHEYWGSTIAAETLKNLSLTKEVIDYIAGIIKLHDTFNAEYWAVKKDWPMDMVINDVKSRAEGLYKEVLFNIYCDCFDAAPFQTAKAIIAKIFNEPKLYEKRQYIIL
ncbi:MAG: HD domain-containing protein [Candidatus Daviesbacteria bacterium]|nr:HD domain-containing protein [Candidatus Daviesbacteria bacterium]